MKDFQTQQRRRNLVVGGFVLLGLATFIWMLVKFGDLPLFASGLRSFTILVKFPDAPGIQKDTPVLYCGYQVGRVMHIAPPTLYENGPDEPSYHYVGVSIAIDKIFNNIPDTININIVKRGLGSSFIEMRVDPSRPVEGYLRDAMSIDGSISTASEFFPPQVQEKLEDLVDSIATLSKNTNMIIGDADNQANIKKTLENVAAATAQATETLKSLEAFTELGAERLDSVTAGLDGAMTELHQLLAKINEGQGSAGKLINDGRLYENLLDSSKELEMALEQIKKWAADAREKGIRIKW